MLSKGWTYVRDRDGADLVVDSDQVLAIWDEGEGSRLWSFACGYVRLSGTAEENAELLDIELPELDEAPE